MCLIMIQWQPGAEQSLVVAANRDELFSRPTRAAAFWEDNPAIYAGRDLEFGGSWLGVNRNGRFAAITNLRMTEHRGEQSRGELVRQFLESPWDAAAFFAELESEKHQYRPFNFVASDGANLLYTDNINSGWRNLPPGISVLGNVPADQASPKRDKGERDFNACLALSNTPEALLAVLQDSQVSEEGEDPLLRELSRRLVSTREYGTRSSTVLIKYRDGKMDFWEQNYEDRQQVTRLRHQRIEKL